MIFATETKAQQIERTASKVYYDQENVPIGASVAIITAGPTLPTIPVPPFPNLTRQRPTISKPVTSANGSFPGYWLHIFRFRRP